MNKRDLAKFGEDIAANYLSHNDYDILQRNYHSVYGEIDIVCKKETQYVFVEVKTRKSAKFGEALAAVTESKRIKIIKTADNYIAKNELEVGVRFDIITLQYLTKEGQYRLKHIKNAFFSEPYSNGFS